MIALSRYTLDLGENGTAAYGFDHACGPFLQLFDAKGDIVEDVDYLFTRSFDCHALAERLQQLAERYGHQTLVRLQHHIDRLWLDLPI